MLYRRCKKFLFDRKKFNLLTKFPKFPYRLATIAVAHRAEKIQKRAIWRKFRTMQRGKKSQKTLKLVWMQSQLTYYVHYFFISKLTFGSETAVGEAPCGILLKVE